ncbi:MAG: hypothetical protein COW03_15475 [Cytophagales bacterium CG12_big_fil_rev_8_21_14_0_65_40_12]|nr:MAG: hypothetical protein COW03_15475 [Cytophagales bacterium CG12_big_fil_rev_8_21_14_0_65_40_12]PIW02811.1 MAG: hypothetical protein COW40_18085 [Cytophagales bacterium CG17_big_fil_post_rev_8_21_14_2_50_40_13]
MYALVEFLHRSPQMRNPPMPRLRWIKKSPPTLKLREHLVEFLQRSPQAQELGNNKLKVDKKKPAFAL